MDQFLKYTKVYSENTEKLIGREFHRLKDQIYLDNAGSALYAESQLRDVFNELSQNIFTNPHARNTYSKFTEDAIDITRNLILQHFNTNSEEYSVIFTSGATESLKLVAEHFNYGKDGMLVHLQNNHTSVLGMRCYAPRSVELKDEVAFKLLSENIFSTNLNTDCDSNSLFVYPAQSNFCGTKYPLDWIKTVKNRKLNKLVHTSSRNWYVILDCATYVSTNDLDLSQFKPDFVPISFYKIFGYPTGLGALLVKNTAEHVLGVKYLGGGTVFMALSSQNVMVPRKLLYEKFESGTLPFLSIIAVKYGFEILKKLNLNFDLISKHTFALAQYAYRNLLVMHHPNEKPLVKLNHETNFDSYITQGGIVNFNLLRDNGEYIGYSEVLHFANLHGIILRTGCFCNPGACQKYLNLSNDDVRKQFNSGHVCGDQHDLVDGYPTGAVRISFGYSSTKEHVDKFLQMIKNCFTTKVIMQVPVNWNNVNNNFQTNSNVWLKNNSASVVESKKKNIEIKGKLKNVFLFPIKSCGAFSVTDQWEITSTGLKYDRQWMIINSSGVSVTQKQNRNLCLIKPTIDLTKDLLILNYKGHPSITVPLENINKKEQDASLCQSKVCGDKIQGWDCGDEVAEWLCKVLDTPGLKLLQQCSDLEEIKGRIYKKGEGHQLSLANKAQYLLVNYASIEWLRTKIAEEDFLEHINNTIHRFRPNFVISFPEAFQETDIKEYFFNNLKFKSGGKCTRCQMICIDQFSGQISKEPLASLSREFQGKISFGVYLNHVGHEKEFIHLDSEVTGIF